MYTYFAPHTECIYNDSFDVLGGPAELAGLVAARVLRRPEVRQLHVPVGGDEDVLRLQVAVRDPAFVDIPGRDDGVYGSTGVREKGRRGEGEKGKREQKEDERAIG